MKSMKKILMVLMVLSMVVVFAGQASAAFKVLECVVEQAGYNVATGDVEVKLFPTSKTSGKVFYVTLAASSEAAQANVLSIALTAMAADVLVKANIDYNSPGEILSMKLLEFPVP